VRNAIAVALVLTVAFGAFGVDAIRLGVPKAKARRAVAQATADTDSDTDVAINEDLKLDVFNSPTGTTAVKLSAVPIMSNPPTDALSLWYTAHSFSQRIGYDAQNLIYCESSALVNAPVQKLLSLVTGPWTWWQGGRQVNRVVKPDGTVDYLLYPAWIGVVVHELMHKPETFLNGFVIRIDFLPDSGSFAQGRGYFLILPENGKTRVYGRFAAVKSRVLPHQFFTATHLKGERGALFPAAIGRSGWYHLIEIAEGRELLPTGYHFLQKPSVLPTK